MNFNIEMIWWTGVAPWEFEFSSQVALYLLSQCATLAVQVFYFCSPHDLVGHLFSATFPACCLFWQLKLPVLATWVPFPLICLFWCHFPSLPIHSDDLDLSRTNCAYLKIPVHNGGANQLKRQSSFLTPHWYKSA